MNITPWDVYWVLQLDSFGVALTLFTVTAALLGLVALLIGVVEEATIATKVGKKALVCAVVGLIIAAALPSSKTAAAMILVPKLTSPEVLRPAGAEMRELFDLAKGALRRVAEKPVNAKPKK